MRAASQPVAQLLLAGATAVGKSAVALALAEELTGEIVSVDAMQVYRGLDIGTAKASVSERKRIPHHLVDIRDVSGSFDAAQFTQLARVAVEQIQWRNRTPILCGGTGLYFKAYLDGLGRTPAPSPALRAELERMTLAELLAELAAKDHEASEKIDRRNRRRLIRAVEVIRLTGQPFSLLRAPWSDTPRAGSEVVAFGLRRTPEDLRDRIDRRVEEMFAAGLVAETRTLLEAGLASSGTALQAIGYRQVVEYLSGTRPLSATIELVKRKTWQLAKRQRTWFRHQMTLEWFDYTPALTARQVAAQIAAAYRSKNNLEPAQMIGSPGRRTGGRKL